MCKYGDEDEKNIIRSNEHENENETLNSFFKGMYNSKRTFKAGSSSSLHKDAYLSSLFTKKDYFIENDENQIFSYNPLDIKDKTINYNEHNYTSTNTAHTLLGYSISGGQTTNGPGHENDLTWTEISNNRNNKILSALIIIDDIPKSEERVRNEIGKAIKYIHISDNRSLDKINQSYYTKYFPDNLTLLSKIDGYLSNPNDKNSKPNNKYTNILEIESNDNDEKITGKQKENLDIKRATHYFKDMMYETKIGSDINAYKNISGSFISLLEEIFINGKLSDIVSRWYYQC